MLGKKQVWVIFLFEFKMGCKAEETTRNINNTFGTGTANEHRVQWWFKKFCKGKEPWRWGVQWLAIKSRNDQLRAIIEVDPLTATWEGAKELSINHSTVIWHLKQIGKMKKLHRLVSHELVANQEKCHFEVLLSLTLHNNNEAFLNRIVVCKEKWILYDNYQKTNLVVGLRRCSKALPKAKFTPKNGHGYCFVICFQSDPLQRSKFLGNHYIWEVCSANRWDALETKMPPAGIGQLKGPDSSPLHGLTASCTTNTLNVERVELPGFASSTLLTWPLANQLPLLQASRQFFAGKLLS